MATIIKLDLLISSSTGEMKMHWTAKITTVKAVLQSVGCERELLHEIKIKKISYLDHLLRSTSYLN